jgi:hypothetical protein
VFSAWPKIPEDLGKATLFSNISRFAEWTLVLGPCIFNGTFLPDSLFEALRSKHDR